jgi:hypothetical protein
MLNISATVTGLALAIAVALVLVVPVTDLPDLLKLKVAGVAALVSALVSECAVCSAGVSPGPPFCGVSSFRREAVLRC